MPSSESSVVVRDLRGHEGIAERALELRSDIEHANPGAGLDPDRVARLEVRTGRIRAHDFLVREDGSLDRGATRKAAVRGHRFDLDHASALLVQEAGMGDVSDPPDAVAVADLLVQTRAVDLARPARRLGPAVHEFVARLRLSLSDERDLDHNKDPAKNRCRAGA